MTQTYAVHLQAMLEEPLEPEAHTLTGSPGGEGQSGGGVGWGGGEGVMGRGKGDDTY